MAERPNTAPEALARMSSLIGMGYPYQLGTGNRTYGTPRGPWDCAGAICEAFEVTRHRPGYARGVMPPGWERFADVVDDINTNSMIKDAVMRQDLFRFVPKDEPLEPGDLLAYPTIIIVDADDGERHKFIGHVQMISDPHGTVSGGPYGNASIIHAHGPNGRTPAVTRGTAEVMDKHNEAWPKTPHRAWALRVVP